MTREHRPENTREELQANERTGVELELERKRMTDAVAMPGKTQKNLRYFLLSTAARALSSLEM